MVDLIWYGMDVIRISEVCLSPSYRRRRILHCRKRFAVSHPFPIPAGMSLTKLSLVENNSLVSDDPAGDRKIDNLFLQCRNGR